jgi:hypothetical protein
LERHQLGDRDLAAGQHDFLAGFDARKELRQHGFGGLDGHDLQGNSPWLIWLG